MKIKEVFSALIDGYGPNNDKAKQGEFEKLLSECLNEVIDKSPIKDKYNVVILFDDSTLVRSDADKIYKALTSFKESKAVLLILYSRGGYPSSAYLIGKMCREYSKDEEFVVSVPRWAKSAATIICCAANSIHMGSLSELGPVDPQIEGLPALGLKNAIDQIAQVVDDHPNSSDMFAKYLHSSLPLINLGYYERVAESSTQYVDRLLSTHGNLLKKGKSPRSIAKSLVYDYKDHGFVIDKKEASDIFGDQIVQTNTDEYNLGNEVYSVLNNILNLTDALTDYSFHYIGSKDEGAHFIRKNK